MNMSTKRSCGSCKGCGTATQESVREFGEVTTLHGVRYVSESQSPIFIRLCWGVAILMCAVFCGFEIQKLYTRWQESPVITVPAQKPTHVTSVPFPAVTICPGNKVLRSAFDIAKNYEQLENYFENDDEEKEQNILVESVYLLCSDVTRDFNFINDNIEPTDDHLEMITQISPNVDHLFQQCYFQGQEMNCSELFRPIYTDEGLCFTFNMLSTEEMFNEKYVSEEQENENIILKNSSWSMEHGYVSGAKDNPMDLRLRDEYPFRERSYLGPISGLAVLLKNNINEVQDSCSSLKNGFNFLVTLHSPHEFPMPDLKHFYISPDSMAMVDLDPEQLIADEELRPPRYTPEIRGCYFPEERPSFIFKAKAAAVGGAQTKGLPPKPARWGK
ncbi:hypothetical protein B566_EDAN002153 [Ephemera danica]|nr:hypothetical protein B566_EDAN002153 [Ephemera danica]